MERTKQDENSLELFSVLHAVSSSDKPAVTDNRRPAHMTLSLHVEADLPGPFSLIRVLSTHNTTGLVGLSPAFYRISANLTNINTHNINVAWHVFFAVVGRTINIKNY